jgi:hypothetical protein
MSNVIFSPGYVLSMVGKLVTDRGSSVTKGVVRVAHMNFNAMAIGPKMAATNKIRKVKEIWYERTVM